MNKLAWRTIVGTLLIMLFLTRSELAVPPRGGLGNQINSVGVTSP